MDTDTDMFLCRSATQLVQMAANIGTDGLLLYVAEASYEPGTSPLSSWIPIVSQEPHPMYSLDLFER
jgi:snurportin-1